MKNLLLTATQFGLLLFIMLTVAYNFLYEKEAKKAKEELEISLPVKIEKLITFNIAFSIFAIIFLIFLFLSQTL